ncbi:MAG TPA: Na+/H+ antiporter NhaC family protein [Patescibacteria group bacterium]|jgi:Na+/H+ antiporter NhaC|nr:Na+/H+ antiporter NhaC family protein [Patescibacteria group bacterium]
MIQSWLSVLPVFIVICITFLTQQLNYALLVGIFLSALISTQGQIPNCLYLLGHHACDQLYSADTWYLYSFLIILPSLIDLFIKTGSATAFAAMITKKIKTKRGIEYASIITSCALAIDDYLSILTTGHVIRSLTDRVGIPRAKLAYLIHALSGNVVILVCISSWVATLTNYLKLSGVGHNQLVNSEPFTLYIQSIPFMAYPLLTIVTVLTIVTFKISFGPMKKEEDKHAIIHVFNDDTPNQPTGKVLNLFGPMLLLFVLIIGSILYQGDCFLFNGQRSILEAFQANTNIFFVLFFSSAMTFLLTSAYFIYQRLIKITIVYYAIIHSFELMKSVLLMIFLVAIFSSLLRNELGTGNYLASIATGYISLAYMPLIFFITATLIAFSTGTSWGTFGLLLPIGIPMIVQLNSIAIPTDALSIPLLCQTIGAIFSGALCGDHLSLFSETTAMSAASAQVPPMLHFKTQLPYGIPVIIGSIVFFGCSGYFYYLSLQYNFLLSAIVGLVSINTGLAIGKLLK